MKNTQPTRGEAYKDKHCKKCKKPLTADNVHSSVVARYRYICKDCFRKMMDRLSLRTFPWEIKKDKYSIEKRKKDSSIPKIIVNNVEDPQDVIFEMLDDTESYRINKIVNLLPLASEAKDIRQIIVFLLKSWDLLTAEQCAIVLNEANNLIGSQNYDPDVRAKMALDLRAFAIASKRKSKQIEFESTFEQLRTTDGKIEVESPV